MTGNADLIAQAREQIAKSDRGEGSEPWAVRALLTALDGERDRRKAAEAERDEWRSKYYAENQNWTYQYEELRKAVAERDRLREALKRIANQSAAQASFVYPETVARAALTAGSGE